MAETRKDHGQLHSRKCAKVDRNAAIGDSFPFEQGEGEHEGEFIHAQTSATGQQSVHRAHFLDELVRSVPSQRAHFNKRIDKLEDKNDGPVKIHFKDGTTATADVVLGADGVHSVVRAHLLGKEAAKPVYAGSVAYRALVPMETALEKLDKEFAENAYIQCGKGMLPGCSRIARLSCDVSACGTCEKKESEAGGEREGEREIARELTSLKAWQL